MEVAGFVIWLVLVLSSYAGSRLNSSVDFPTLIFNLIIMNIITPSIAHAYILLKICHLFDYYSFLSIIISFCK